MSWAKMGQGFGSKSERQVTTWQSLCGMTYLYTEAQVWTPGLRKSRPPRIKTLVLVSADGKWMYCRALVLPGRRDARP